MSRCAPGLLRLSGMLVLAVAASADARAAPPSRVDRQAPDPQAVTVHTVRLRSSPPGDCISIPAGRGISFVLERADVERMARARPGGWKTEEERMQRVRSVQARALLAPPAGSGDSLGCEVREEPGDGRYALLELLRRQRARAWDAESRSFLPYLQRLDDNLDCRHGPSGAHVFRTPQGRAFMSIPVCVR